MQVRELCVQYRPRPDLPPFDHRRVLKTPRDIVEFLLPILDQEPVEVFVMAIGDQLGVVERRIFAEDAGDYYEIDDRIPVRPPGTAGT